MKTRISFGKVERMREREYGEGWQNFLALSESLFGGVVGNLVRSTQKPGWRVWTLSNRPMGRNSSFEEMNDRMNWVLYLDFLVWIERVSLHSLDCSELTNHPEGFLGGEQGPSQECELIANAWCSVSGRQVDSQRTQWALDSWNKLSHAEGNMRNTIVNSDPIINSPSLLSWRSERSRFWPRPREDFQQSHLPALGSTPGQCQELRVAAMWFPQKT